jgi:hypothetical protein
MLGLDCDLLKRVSDMSSGDRATRVPVYGEFGH